MLTLDVTARPMGNVARVQQDAECVHHPTTTTTSSTGDDRATRTPIDALAPVVPAKDAGAQRDDATDENRSNRPAAVPPAAAMRGGHGAVPVRDVRYRASSGNNSSNSSSCSRSSDQSSSGGHCSDSGVNRNDSSTFVAGAGHGGGRSHGGRTDRTRPAASPQSSCLPQYGCCVFFFPTSFMSWFFPFLGHVGITDAEGSTLYTFESSYFVREEPLAEVMDRILRNEESATRGVRTTAGAAGGADAPPRGGDGEEWCDAVSAKGLRASSHEHDGTRCVSASSDNSRNSANSCNITDTPSKSCQNSNASRDSIGMSSAGGSGVTRDPGATKTTDACGAAAAETVTCPSYGSHNHGNDHYYYTCPVPSPEADVSSHRRVKRSSRRLYPRPASSSSSLFANTGVHGHSQCSCVCIWDMKPILMQGRCSSHHADSRTPDKGGGVESGESVVGTAYAWLGRLHQILHPPESTVEDGTATSAATRTACHALRQHANTEPCVQQAQPQHEQQRVRASRASSQTPVLDDAVARTYNRNLQASVQVFRASADGSSNSPDVLLPHRNSFSLVVFVLEACGLGCARRSFLRTVPRRMHARRSGDEAAGMTPNLSSMCVRKSATAGVSVGREQRVQEMNGGAVTSDAGVMLTSATASSKDSTDTRATTVGTRSDKPLHRSSQDAVVLGDDEVESSANKGGGGGGGSTGSATSSSDRSSSSNVRRVGANDEDTLANDADAVMEDVGDTHWGVPKVLFYLWRFGRWHRGGHWPRQLIYGNSMWISAAIWVMFISLFAHYLLQWQTSSDRLSEGVYGHHKSKNTTAMLSTIRLSANNMSI